MAARVRRWQGGGPGPDMDRSRPRDRRRRRVDAHDYGLEGPRGPTGAPESPRDDQGIAVSATPGTDGLLRRLEKLAQHFERRAYGHRRARLRASLRRLSRMLDDMLGPYGL